MSVCVGKLHFNYTIKLSTTRISDLKCADLPPNETNAITEEELSMANYRGRNNVSNPQFYLGK